MIIKKVALYFVICSILGACGQTSNTKKSDKESGVQATPNTSVPEKKVNQSQDFNVTILLEAALNGNLDRVKKALDKGFDANTRGEEDRTALMLASFNGHTELVKVLLSNGASVNLKDNTDRTALMFACTGPFAETVRVLLDAGADVNLKDNHENWTAFMFAAGEGQIEVMKLLIDANADINARDIDGESAYDFAVNNKHKDAADFIKPLMQN